jgi:hypothetical protein
MPSPSYDGPEGLRIVRRDKSRHHHRGRELHGGALAHRCSADQRTSSFRPGQALGGNNSGFDDRAEQGGGSGLSEGHAGILTTAEDIDTWMNAPTEEALKLQRPLADDALMIVARGEKKDEGGVAA